LSPRPATRPSRLFFLGWLGAFFVTANGWRKDVERNGLATAIHTRLTVFVVASIVGGLLVRIPRTALPVAAIEAFTSIAAVFALLALVACGLLFARIDEFVLAFLIIEILAALAPLVLKARAAFAQHAEIMVRELQIIFGLDAIAGKLGVARHILVFFEQLRGIAPLTIVLAVPRLSAEVLSPLSPATAPAAATLSIVDQMPTSLRSVVSPLGPQSGRTASADPDPLVPVSR